MRKITSIFLIISMLIGLCSCSLTLNKTTFTVGVLDEIQCFDPLKATGDAEKIIAANCFEGLLRFDQNGHIDLAGATGYSVSPDMLTYTFTLNPSAKWYVSDKAREAMKTAGLDGFSDTITAYDYIFTKNRLSEEGYEELSCIEKIYAKDNYTLEIALKEADIDFLYTVASAPFYPCNEAYFNALGELYGTSPDTVITNGIYRIEEISETGGVTLTENASYAGNLQLLNNGVYLYPTGKESALLARFENEDYDIFLSQSSETKLGKAATDPTYPDSVWGLAFNFRQDTVNNTNLRKAIVNATDFSLVKAPSFAVAEADRLIPGNFTVINEPYESFETGISLPEYSSQKAAEYFKKALSQLKTDSVTVKIAVPEQLEENFSQIIDSFGEIFKGKLTAELTVFSVKAAKQVAAEGDYHIAVLPLTPEFATAASCLECISQSPCFFTNEKLEKYKGTLYSQADKNAENFTAAEQYIIDSCIFIPMFCTGTTLCYSSNVKGIYCADNGNLIYFHLGVKNN